MLMHPMLAGSPVPLFDRLDGMTAHGSKPDAGSLRSSLRQDLARLFNARNSLTIEQFLSDARTPLHYGMPDTLGLSPQSSTDLQRWEQIVARAIALYEPRLVQVSVEAAPDPGRPASARVAITGMAALDRRLYPVRFDLVVDGQASQAGVRVNVPEHQP
jgi:type VI secretion system protein ImpF